MSLIILFFLFMIKREVSNQGIIGLHMIRAYRDLNEDEVQRSNRHSGLSAAMVRSGPRLSKTLELIRFNLLSHKKYQRVLLSALIPRKYILASQHEETFIVSSITVKNNNQTEKENHINGLEELWGYLKRKLSSKGGILRKKLPLYLGITFGGTIIKQSGKDKN